MLVQVRVLHRARESERVAGDEEARAAARPRRPAPGGDRPGRFRPGRRFAAAASAPTRTASLPPDFNGDGRTDIATASATAGRVTVFARGGSGGFSGESSDLDSPGASDRGGRLQRRRPTKHLGPGERRLRLAAEVRPRRLRRRQGAVLTGRGHVAITAADLNGDGPGRLVNAKRVHRLRRTTRCATPRTPVTRHRCNGRPPATRTRSPSRDFTGDGRPDIVATNDDAARRRPLGPAGRRDIHDPLRRTRRSPWAAAQSGWRGRLQRRSAPRRGRRRQPQRHGRRHARPGRWRLRAGAVLPVAGDGPVGVEAGDFNFDGRPRSRDRATRAGTRVTVLLRTRAASVGPQARRS